jgi:CHAT domain-containing protein
LLLQDQGKLADAERCHRDALAMYRRLAVEYARYRPEGDALTLAASQPPARDFSLSVTRDRGRRAADVYADVWDSRAALSRVYEQRHLAARAAAADPKAAELLGQLAEARHARSHLILARAPADPATRQKRDDALSDLAERVARLDRELRPLLPAVDRADRLAQAAPRDLQRALPDDAAFIDLLGYTRFEFDTDKPGRDGEKRTRSYVGFVLSRGRVARVELGPAEPIDQVVRDWRRAITGSRSVPPDLAAAVRRLVWDPLSKELPEGTQVVYLAPDLGLTPVPWAALPGGRPGTVLLEEHALAVVPHGPALLDRLWPDEPRPDRKDPGPGGVLVVGGVDYAAEPARTDPPAAPGAVRSGPAVEPGAELSWPALPGAAAEAAGVAALAGSRRLTAVRLSGSAASAERALAELPRAAHAHLATHGFFADPAFRSDALRSDPRLFEMRGTERVGAGVLSPLTLTGLALAGAGRPGTPGRGLLTGGGLIDLDLTGLRLVVLSACDTGLGDVAGGSAPRRRVLTGLAPPRRSVCAPGTWGLSSSRRPDFPGRITPCCSRFPSVVPARAPAACGVPWSPSPAAHPWRCWRIAPAPAR